MTAALPSPQGFRFTFDPATAVGTVTLNRPERLNALTFSIYRELADFFADLKRFPAVRALVLAGEGRAFCAGGDVQDIIGELFSKDAAGLLEFTRMTGELIGNIRRTNVPVIAAVHGVAVGAGAVMATACDVRVFGESGRIGFIFPQVGLCGADMGAAYLLPRIVGYGRASELLLTGEILDAREAHRIGLANHVVPTDAVLAKATALAETIARGPAFAHRMTRAMLENEWTMNLASALEAEAQAQALCMMHPDFRTAFEANTNKRAPVFEGAPTPNALGTGGGKS